VCVYVCVCVWGGGVGLQYAEMTFLQTIVPHAQERGAPVMGLRESCS
jgi:hypothetical protein